MAKSLRSLVIVDDHEDDALVMRFLLERAGVSHPVHCLTHAEDAVAFLANLADHRQPDDSPVPLACFVDVNMAGFDGIELIEWVRNHGVFDRMALVALSASEDPRDLATTARLGAQCYVAKFPTADVVREILQAAEEFGATGSAASFGFPANLFRGRSALPQVKAPESMQ